MPADHHPAEFDAFAPGYDAGMDDPLKSLIGGSPDTFFEQKADWLVRMIAPAGRLLDFGCGTGDFLRAVRRRRESLDLVGCDLSGGMIEEARRRWDVGPLPALHALRPGPLPYADAEFDVATAVNVFHHIDGKERAAIACEILRVVRPGGAVVIIEHNPRNPVTRWLVRRAPLDVHAVLLDPSECGDLLRKAGAAACRIEYSLFFPPRFRFLSRAERWLRRWPLGGQFAAIATRSR